VNAAGGLVWSLAQACDYVAARPAARIGWLSLTEPLEPSPWLNEFLPVDDGRERGFTAALNRRLKSGFAIGEQLEGRGVDWVHRGTCIDTALWCCELLEANDA
jgi:hypothetical protein